MDHVTVTFELQLFTDTDLLQLTESAVRDDLDNLRELLGKQRQIEGVIVIEAPRQPRVEIGDDLWAAAQNLCFTLVARANEETAECLLYSRWNAEGYVVMLPDPDLVWLIGNEIPSMVAPRSELLPALYGCGVRIVELLDRAGGTNRDMAEYLRPFEARARAALSAGR